MRVIAEEAVELFSHIGRSLVVGENTIPDEQVTYGLRRALERREAVGVLRIVRDEPEEQEPAAPAAPTDEPVIDDAPRPAPAKHVEPVERPAQEPTLPRPPQQQPRRRRRKR